MSSVPLIFYSEPDRIKINIKRLVLYGVLLLIGFGVGLNFTSSNVVPVTAQLPVLDDDSQLDRPIVGILSLSYSPEFLLLHQVHIPPSARGIIPSSYVKWLQSAGAQVIVIPHFWESDAIADLVSKLSGVLFTGGDYGDDAWNHTTSMIFQQALDRNGTDHPLVLWGTCLGFERIIQVASHDSSNAVVAAPLVDESIPVVWASSLLTSSPFFKYMGVSSLDAFSSRPIAYNFHNYGVTPGSWAAHSDTLDPLFDVIGTHKTNDLEFVAMIEGKNGLLVYGIQFHPEKALFEWSPNLHYPHSEIGVLNNRRIADFLINKVRHAGGATFLNFQDESQFAIYNYQTIFTGISTNGGPIFTETYIIDK